MPRPIRVGRLLSSDQGANNPLTSATRAKLNPLNSSSLTRLGRGRYARSWDTGALAPSSGWFDLSIQRARATSEGLAAARQALQNRAHHSKINLTALRGPSGRVASRGRGPGRYAAAGTLVSFLVPLAGAGGADGYGARRDDGAAPGGALMEPR